MADGFNSYEGNAVMCEVVHNHGTTYVHALSDANDMLNDLDGLLYGV